MSDQNAENRQEYLQCFVGKTVAVDLDAILVTDVVSHYGYHGMEYYLCGTHRDASGAADEARLNVTESDPVVIDVAEWLHNLGWYYHTPSVRDAYVVGERQLVVARNRAVYLNDDIPPVVTVECWDVTRPFSGKSAYFLTVDQKATYAFDGIVDETALSLFPVWREMRTGFASGTLTGNGPRMRVALLGAPGTGKTHTALQYAQFLRRPVCVVSLEGRSNLRRDLHDLMRDAAELDVVLLLDEAAQYVRDDGRNRSENQELFLSLLESDGGQWFFTANLTRDELDRAVLDRLADVLTYQLPSEQELAAMWRRTCAADADTVKFKRYAKQVASAVAGKAAYRAVREVARVVFSATRAGYSTNKAVSLALAAFERKYA